MAGSSIRAGENGSGPRPIPVIYDRTMLTRALTPSDIITFSDLGLGDLWARTAVQHVAGTNPWMRDFAALPDGTYPFRPDAIETRKYLARALVKAFAPLEAADPTIAFSDVDPASPWYRWAAVASVHGWLVADPSGAFAPDDPVSMATVQRSLVFALGLQDAAHGLNTIHTAAGQTFRVPPSFGSLVLGLRLGLRYNAPTGSESMDVGPTDLLTRAQVAFSLFHATTQPEWNLADLHEQYANVELPHLGEHRYDLVQWGIRWAGYPYVWGGEWGLSSPEPAELGAQPRSGFDCSGFSWWLLRANDGGAWKVNPPRPYAGWSLPPRTSREMAATAPTRLRYADLKPGDLMFYDGDFDGVVDHVDTFIGNGFTLDSSSTPGGVTVMWVGDGWYREHFKFGRRVLPA